MRLFKCDKCGDVPIYGTPYHTGIDLYELIGQSQAYAAALRAAQPCICFSAPLPDCPKHGANCKTGDIGIDD